MVLLAVIAWAGPARAQAPASDPNAPRPKEGAHTTPVLGNDVPLSQVPADVQVIDRQVLDARPTQSLATTLADQINAGSFTDTQGNAFNTTLNLRGYSASPVLGSAQGVSVYQNGTRVNDPFGDLVNWATIPSFAVQQIQVTPGVSPTFGLNALGGSASLQMKDGFSAPGGRFTVLGGSWDRVGGTAEYGGSSGLLGFYGGVSALHDPGWREGSPSGVYQGYLDLRARGDALDGGLSIGFTHADFVGNGGSPRELLDQSYKAIFTKPDETEQDRYDLSGRASYTQSDRTRFQGVAYWRQNKLATSNGDDTELAPCTGDPSVLCTDAGLPGEKPASDAGGAPVPASLDVTGQLNTTETRTQALGSSLELVDHRDLFARENRFTLGSSLDYGFSHYDSGSELGRLNDARGVEGLDVALGGEDFNTAVRSQTRYFGIYLSDVYALSDKLSATASGRWNLARTELHDLAGTALDGTHHFDRLNPALGLSYAWTPELSTYLSYGESNRTPTPAELACADPARPCRIPNAFSADPSLDQVVSRSVELGSHGDVTLPWEVVTDYMSIHWSGALYAAWNHDDILFIASGPVLGSGFFSNAGTTQRLGAELSLDGRWARGTGFVRYGWVHATFESHLAIRSPNNPFADANGNIHVAPGDRLPNVPEHDLRFGFQYRLTPQWSAGFDGVYVSSRPYQGDESNQLKPVSDYSLLNFETDYELARVLTLRLRVQNLFNQKYYSAGVLGDPTGVFPDFRDPRFLTPGAPTNFEVQAIVRF